MWLYGAKGTLPVQTNPRHSRRGVYDERIHSELTANLDWTRNGSRGAPGSACCRQCSGEVAEVPKDTPVTGRWRIR
jgi:hypothetical protein